MAPGRERFVGAITSWNDERGFGFITPGGGGRDIFLHISELDGGPGRPQLGEDVTFLVGTTKDGKRRATAVRRLSGKGGSSPRSRRMHERPNLLVLLLIPAFAAGYYAIAAIWPVPLFVAGIYAAASILCFLMYCSDKSAARAGRWRQSESSLLTVGLIGGWPGALLAQQLLRHKTRKVTFQATFWGTVFLNVTAFVVLAATVFDGQS